MRDLGKPLASTFGDKPKKKKRSAKLMSKAIKTASKGHKAVDEGRKKKANRILKKSASLENRSIIIREGK